VNSNNADMQMLRAAYLDAARQQQKLHKQAHHHISRHSSTTHSITTCQHAESLSNCGTAVMFFPAVQSPGLWNPVLFSFYPTAAAASVAINVATLRSGFAQSGTASVQEGLASLAKFSAPKTPAGWTYSLFILLYIATGEHFLPTICCK
jgi:hypothetical protein